MEKETTMKLTSTAFENGGIIPAKYTCSGGNMNPPLAFVNLPSQTQSLVLVMDDVDIPQEIKEKMDIKKFDHWVVYNLRPDITGELFPENYYNHPEIEFEKNGIEGKNTQGEDKYAGPCPPTEYEPSTHRYSFRLYALPEMLSFESTPTLDEVESAAKEMMLAQAELMGIFSRK